MADNPITDRRSSIDPLIRWLSVLVFCAMAPAVPFAQAQQATPPPPTQAAAPGTEPANAEPPAAKAAAPVAASDDRPFARLFQNLGRDLRALPSRDSGLVLGMGSAGTLAIRGADDNLAAWAGEEGASGYTGFGRVLGDGWLQAGAATGTYVVGRLTGQPAIAHVGSDLVRAQVLNGLVTRGLKIAVTRSRPTGGRHAFPSGHASAAFTSAAVLQGHFGWKTGIPAYAVASLVGWTRVRDRAHWMSDVIFGATLGTIAGRTVTAGHRREPGWTIVPVATYGGAAVHVVKR